MKSGQTAPTHVRYLVLATLFLVSTFSYGDRVGLSITGISFAKDLHLTPLQLGYLFSGFSWAYVVAQLPAGWMLDRFGTKRVYGVSIMLWSVLAAAAGFAGYLKGAVAFSVIFGIRLLSGLAQSPVFPGNGRVVAAWFPSTQRGTASAIFNSSQYFALVVFSPLLGWMSHAYGWKECFWFLGALGIVLTLLWVKTIDDVKSHPAINAAEIETIEGGGGLCVISAATRETGVKITWKAVGRLLSTRMLVGIYLGQYCITTLTWFFLTWFPLYLAQARHLSIGKVGLAAALPALFGSIGGILGGLASDKLLKSGRSLSFSRKAPIVAGMALATTMMLCNVVDTQWGIMVLMSVAFFGKGFGALGWTVISDTSPKGMVGLNGGMFNLCGNIAGITTPIVIGYIVQRTGSFRYALIYVGLTALLAIASYLLVTGPIRRLTPEEMGAAPAVL
ncbi:MAG: D-galactonate transporter [Acidobacteriaceae bacterium]|nr:D-galactonate transporter [Acidobacteriaceae bacterium]